MGFIHNRCPNCSGEIGLDEKTHIPVCLYCGSVFVAERGSTGSTHGSGYAGDIVFSAVIDDVFEIKGRGVVVTCRIAKGELSVNDEVQIIDKGNNYVKSAKVTGIEAFRKLKDKAREGENVGVLLEGVTKSDLQNASIICM